MVDQKKAPTEAGAGYAFEKSYASYRILPPFLAKRQAKFRIGGLQQKKAPPQILRVNGGASES
jgi:hypothetical protein